jgi:hypothetical protein
MLVHITHSSLRITAILSVLTISVYGAQCSEQGKLKFVGVTSDGANSVWLSATTAGAFNLDAQNLTVDSWNKEKSGLHLSRSPIVSNGNGGTHKLSAGQGCLLDSKNQQGGFILPPSIIPPGAIRPPIGVLPQTPVTPITPALPGGVTPPIATLPESTVNKSIQTEIKMYDISSSALPDCSQIDSNTSAQRPECSKIALSETRQFDDSVSQWNIWADATYTRIDDERGIFETRSDVRSLLLGADRLITPDMAAGLQIGFNKGHSDSFGGEMIIESKSYLISPYATYRISPQWRAYGSFGLGEQTNDEKILSLTGTSKVMQYAVNLEIEGQYPLENDVFIRPKIQSSYTNHESDDYQLNGTLLNQSISVNAHNEKMDYGVMQTSVEVNRLFYQHDHSRLMPYLEGGIFREYANEDPEWGGFLRGGIRKEVGKSTMVSFDVGYQSIGIQDLSIWNMQMLASHLF